MTSSLPDQPTAAHVPKVMVPSPAHPPAMRPGGPEGFPLAPEPRPAPGFQVSRPRLIQLSLVQKTVGSCPECCSGARSHRHSPCPPDVRKACRDGPARRAASTASVARRTGVPTPPTRHRGFRSNPFHLQLPGIWSWDNPMGSWSRAMSCGRSASSGRVQRSRSSPALSHAVKAARLARRRTTRIMGGRGR